MNCQDALDLLHEIIDKEASEIDTQEVKKHLDNCRDCFQKYHIEESVQDFLNEKFNNSKEETVSSEKLKSLKLKISDKLDEIDCENNNNHHKGFFGLSGRSLLAAASLVLLASAAYFSAGFIRHYNTYAPIEEAHINAEANTHIYNNPQVTTTMIQDMASDLNYYTINDLNNYRLVGGRVEEVMGVPMNHLVYSNKSGDAVSLFIVSSDKFEIPKKLEDTKQILGDSYFYKHHCEGCNLVYFNDGTLTFITASTNNTLELSEFIPPNVI